VPPPFDVPPPVVDPPPVVEPPVFDPLLSVVEPEVVSSFSSLRGPNFITERTEHKNREPAKVLNIPLSTVIDIF
jgi:hypothetical protein